MGISKIFYIFILATIVSGCGLNKMASKYETVSYTVAPPTLQAHAGKVTLTLDASFAENYFAKKATVDFTPVLIHENGETAFKTITVQGEEATGGEATIFYASGGNFSYQDAIAYDKDMMTSHLELRATAKMNDSEKILGPKTLAQGVLATAERVQNTEVLAMNNHGYEKETILEETATIYFLVNQSNIRTTEKSDDDIKKLSAFAQLGYQTHSIEVKSYASPEGSVNTNDNVSERRMKSTLSYTKRLLKKLKMNGAKNNDLYAEISFGEDWGGFNQLMKSSDIKDKRRITKIVNSVVDLEKREQAIRDMAEIYDAIESDVLPQLRKAIITIRAYEPKRTDEEIAALSTTNPAELDVKELLYAATLTDDRANQIDIYNKAVELHNDWRGHNNIGCIYLAENNHSEATAYLNKAEKIGGSQHDISVNKGIIAARDGKLGLAQKLFDQGNASEHNQAVLDIRQGEYKKAVRYFNNAKTHNATLAQIMNSNNHANCNENTAACHYLNAIAAARTGNNDAAISNLTKAINIDAAYKNEAVKDLEFVNLREYERFQSLTK